MRHNRGYGIMAELVERRAMPIDRLEIRVRTRHLDVIVARNIEGAVAADAEIGAGGGNQCLRLWQDQALGYGRRSGREIGGEIVALVTAAQRISTFTPE